jgi:pyruvate-formate lyase-activating enzyme
VDGPGNRFVVFLQGCGFDCLACHNPHTIPRATPRARGITVADLVEEIRPAAPFLSGVTVSGGEATLQAPFVRALFTALRADDDLSRLTTFVDTNGSAPRAVWDDLLPVTDGVMVDLKALDPQVHTYLTGHANDLVLESIPHLARARKLHEVRLLLVPGVNDSPEQLGRTAAWLLSVDPELRVKVIGFRAHGVRAAARGWAEPTPEQREDYRALLTAAGVRDLVVV